ncbi:hypothetical protein POM88_009549 [Heracleum sosnowskyi]|uniref:Uncharacterized protein n=1 Tax=Heracleum sosnowskyi TaxID=360622 RepID=A0AAD8JBP3_9APIA|nr:hypothetical protein POM88_009549 [Heracleum sosnowskyi]
MSEENQTASKAEQVKPNSVSRYETIRVPILRPVEYPIWKVKMTMFLEATDPEYLDRINDGPHMPTKLSHVVDGQEQKTVPKEKKDMTPEDISSIAKDAKVRHLLHSALDNVMSNRVIGCKTAKEIWDALEVRCQGTGAIKKNRKTILTLEYEHFDSRTNETLTETYDRFCKLLNDLSLVDKEYELEESNLKFLLSLPEKWDLKATTIRDNYDLADTDLDEIYGLLKTHELEIEQRNRRSSKKTKSVALKVEEKPIKKESSRKKAKGKALVIKSESESSNSDDDSNSDEASDSEDDEEEMMQMAALMVKTFKKMGFKNFKKGKRFSRRDSNSEKKNFRKSDGRDTKSGKKDKSEIQCYKCKEMGHYAPECKKGRTEKALISKGKDWADTSDSDDGVNYALMATIKDEVESSENKVPLTTYAYDTDNISELRIYLKNIHVSYRDQTLENERIKSENLSLKERNKFLERELVNMKQIQKERDDAVYVEQELLKRYKQLESDLEKERKIIKTWTDSGRDTHQVFQTDSVGLGYCENDELRFKDKVKVKPQLKPVKFVPEANKLKSVVIREADMESDESCVKQENIITEKLMEIEAVRKPVKTCEKQVNVGLMTGKQFNHKLREVKSSMKPKGSKRNRNGKVGINNRNNHMPNASASRKTCYSCGSSNHLARFCTKNKHINTLPSTSEVKNDYVRVKPQTLCKHCGSTWHSIYTCKSYHAIYHNYYELKPNLKWVRANSASVKSDNVSLNSDNTDSAAKANTGIIASTLILDSGCSGHMTGNKALLSDFEEKAGPKVSYGDGNIGHTLGYVNINLGSVIITNVALVSGLKHNLLSVSQICDRGNHVDFHSEYCEVISKSTGKVVLVGHRRNNIYEASLVTNSDGSTVCLTAKMSNESWNWHKKLSHLNLNNINELIRKDLVRGLPKSILNLDGLCDSCQKAKQRKSSFKSKSESSVVEPYHLLHVDLFGPVNVMSMGRKKYALVIVDEYTRYTWVYFLSKKDETAQILMDHVNLLDKGSQHKVKIIRSDNGTEFRNSILEAFCKERGVKQEFSAPGTPQQNGVVERKNRTLFEAARTKLFKLLVLLKMLH